MAFAECPLGFAPTLAARVRRCMIRPLIVAFHAASSAPVRAGWHAPSRLRSHPGAPDRLGMVDLCNRTPFRWPGCLPSGRSVALRPRLATGMPFRRTVAFYRDLRVRARKRRPLKEQDTLPGPPAEQFEVDRTQRSADRMAVGAGRRRSEKDGSERTVKMGTTAMIGRKSPYGVGSMLTVRPFSLSRSS